MLRVEKEKPKGKTVEGHVHAVGSIAVKLANGRHNYLSETARWNRSWRALISIPPPGTRTSVVRVDTSIFFHSAVRHLGMLVGPNCKKLLLKGGSPEDMITGSSTFQAKLEGTSDPF